MGEKQEPVGPKAPGSINVGDINGATGVAIGHGASATVSQMAGATDEMAKAFAAVFGKVNALPPGASKEDAIDAVKRLEAEARKGDQADENRVQRWFSFLAETAPDAWEVAIDTFINPIKGVSTLFQKIAAKAKAEKAK